MNFRLATYVLLVATLVVSSPTAMADQSGKLVGVHEIPSFVLERVELLPTGLSDQRSDDGSATQPKRAAS